MSKENLPAENNQFFAVQAKGRTGLQEMVSKMKDQMWQTRPAFLPDTQKEVFFQKAIMNIANDEKLNCLTATREGLYQIFLQLQKGVQLGMVPGGVRPQFYIVPRKKYENGQFKGQYIATFVPTQDGYRYALTTGSTAVFRDITWGVVRDGYTKFKIDEVNGVIEHEYDPIKTAKGEILGVWVRCHRINRDDTDIVKFVSAEKILSIRDNYSDAWKYAKTEKDKAGTVWMKSAEDQYVKTAVKSVLKHYISKSEGMSQLAAIEAIEEEKSANYNAQPMSDRMSERLDAINEQIPDQADEIPAGAIVDETPADVEPQTDEQPAEQASSKKLF